MKKDLKFISCQPDDDYYIWQVHLWLESLKEIGHSNKAIVLVFTPNFREYNTKWNELEKLYPESEFFKLKDEDGISKILGIYIPILRPYILMKYFQRNPQMREKAVFYCDSDILFTKHFNIEKYINDDIIYVSDTLSYINATYFDSKVKDVLPDKLEEYKKRDILEETTKLVGISREIAEKYNMDSGGAQYLLKNIDASFWDKVITDCLKIRLHLQDVNKQYFESESKGFQAWCADMWAVLWNVWKREQEAKIVPEMEFAWSSDSVTKLERVGILHNAGITGITQGDIPVFFKGTYHQGKSPFTDEYVEFVYNNEKSKTLCNHYYVQKLLELKNNYYSNLKQTENGKQ